MIRIRPIPTDIRSKIDSLIHLLMDDPNVIFAYLFGGLAKERFHPLSDVDLAFYLKDSKKIDYLDIFRNISNTLGTDEIDLVILNSAPLSLSGRILQNKKNLVDKAPFLRHQYESLILREFFDFAIKERMILKRRYGIG